MKFHGLITTAEPRSYKRKSGDEVHEITYTCIDWDPSMVRLKDTVDVTVSQADRVALEEKVPNRLPIGQIVQFDVKEIRPGQFGPRLRFTATVPLEQFQQSKPNGK